MGRFFSNIHIHNKDQKNREQFTKAFCKSIEKKGYSVGTEDDSEFSYILAFSEYGNWITLCSADYESGGESVKKDARLLAESLKTCCISTGVIDSDFAILEMYNSTSVLTDMVLVGDGSGYGFEDDADFQGKEECWKPFLVGNATWEQFSKIRNGDYVFIEEALAEMAPLIGMDSQNILSDYEGLESDAENNPNIVTLYFKKKGKKALSLNAAFKQIFGEALEPLGFKKIKGKQPYFVRVVEGGEIIHVITYTNETTDDLKKKYFSILGGVATVYRQSLDLTKNPRDNIGFLSSNLEFYRKRNPFDPVDVDRDTFKKLYRFWYKVEDNESLLCAVKQSLEATKQFMLSVIDEVTDIDSCIRHLFIMGKIMRFNENFEGFLFLKTNNYTDIIEEHLNRNRVIYEYNVKVKKPGYAQEELERRRQRYEEVNKREIAPIEEIFTNSELYAEYTEKLERRKAANIEILKSYGLNV